MTDSNSQFKHKLLVVDDQYGILAFLNDFFTNKDYEVLQAAKGREAINIVKKERPSIVLLDIDLGWGRNGMQVLEEIKSIAPEVGVIMMTGESDEDIIERAFSLGADDYIVKPLSLSYLERVVLLKILNLEVRTIGKDNVEDHS
ncbi:response regulator [Candidatus Omnitrophota bacterium]